MTSDQFKSIVLKQCPVIFVWTPMTTDSLASLVGEATAEASRLSRWRTFGKYLLLIGGISTVCMAVILFLHVDIAVAFNLSDVTLMWMFLGFMLSIFFFGLIGSTIFTQHSQPSWLDALLRAGDRLSGADCKKVLWICETHPKAEAYRQQVLAQGRAFTVCDRMVLEYLEEFLKLTSEREDNQDACRALHAIPA